MAVVENWKTYSVQTKEAWDDEEWTPQPHLICNRLAKNCIGQIDSAALLWRTGSILQPGTDVFADIPIEPTFSGHWVRISATFMDSVWIGYCLAPGESPVGVALNDEDLITLTGVDYDFIAVDPKYFLERRQVITSVVYSEDEEENPLPKRINRAIGFNMGIGGDDREPSFADRGNKDDRPVEVNWDEEGSPDERPVFCSDPEHREEWHAGEIIEHLLTFQGLRDQHDIPAPFEILFDRVMFDTYVDWLKPTLATEGRTTLYLLNQILNPQNGLVWWLEFDELTGTFALEVNSVYGTAVTLPGELEIPASSTITVLDIDTPLDVADTQLDSVGNKRYDRIRVRGARRTATFTVSHDDGNFAKAWTDELETAYKAAGTATEAKVADRRRKADKFAGVYTRYRVPPGWDGKSGDGSGDEELEKEFCCPDVPPDSESIVGGATMSMPGMRLLSSTMLKEGHDYTDATAPTGEDPADTAPEFMRPLALIKIGEKFVPMDRSAGETDEDEPTLKHSYHVRILTGTLGLEIKSSGGLPHAIAKNHFDTEDEGTAPSKIKPETDYEEIRVTLSAEWDAYCEGVFPEGSVTATPLQELVIDISERARWDYLAEHTIFDVVNDVIKKCTTGGSIRDDRNLCRQLAWSAYRWYATERKTLAVSYKNLQEPVRLGDFIEQVGVEDTLRSANCTVTQIVHDLEDGRTSISAGFDDIEFTGGLV
jgi:hypothetical protein